MSNSTHLGRKETQMTSVFLEHANITVRDSKNKAAELCNLFGWKIRWEGEGKNNGTTVHVGSEESYLALWEPVELKDGGDRSDRILGHLNHVGVVVGDLDATEQRIKDAGFTTYFHADYEPGKRFYFDFYDDMEIEVVSYS